MDLDKGAVKGGMVNVFRDYPLMLEFLEYSGKDSSFHPASHPVINGVPMAKLLG
jgi:hypothetical protein